MSVAHLHGIDCRLRNGAGQRAGSEAFQRVQLPVCAVLEQPFDLKQVHFEISQQICTQVNDSTALHETQIATCLNFFEACGPQQKGYLFICHELDSRLGSYFDHIHAVASPQGPDSALLEHEIEATDDPHLAALRSMHLKQPSFS